MLITITTYLEKEFLFTNSIFLNIKMEYPAKRVLKVGKSYLLSWLSHKNSGKW